MSRAYHSSFSVSVISVFIAITIPYQPSTSPMFSSGIYSIVYSHNSSIYHFHSRFILESLSLEESEFESGYGMIMAPFSPSTKFHDFACPMIY